MDTPDNRSYISRHRLWLLGEVISMHLVTKQPEDPFGAVAAVLRAEKSKPTEAVDAPTASVVNAAQEYLQRHQIGPAIEAWLAQLLDIKPAQPIDFSIDHFIKLAAAHPPLDAAGAPPQSAAPTKSPQPQLTAVESAPATAQQAPPAAAAQAPSTTSSEPPAKTAAPPSAQANVLIAYYSAYGHVRTLALSIKEGVEATGARVTLRRFQETLPDEVLEKMHIVKDTSVPVVTNDDLVAASGMAFGFPTRFGTAPAQVQAFLDGTGQLWAQGALVGKAAGTFVSTSTQHGGQEATVLRFNTFLHHHGMAVVGGVPHGGIDGVQGCSPYGVSTIAGNQGDRQVSAEEKQCAVEFGKRLGTIATKLSK